MSRRDLGRAGERHAGTRAGRATSAAPMLAVARQEAAAQRRHAGFVQQLDGEGGDQWRLFGRLGDDGIAGGQRRGDLADENRQREIPRADADEDAAAVQRQAVALAGRAGQSIGCANVCRACAA